MIESGSPSDLERGDQGCCLAPLPTTSSSSSSSSSSPSPSSLSKHRSWNNKGSRTPEIHAFSSEEDLLSAFLQPAAQSGLVRDCPGQLAGAFCKAVTFITGENSLPPHKALLDPGPRNRPCTRQGAALHAPAFLPSVELFESLLKRSTKEPRFAGVSM